MYSRKNNQVGKLVEYKTILHFFEDFCSHMNFKSLHICWPLEQQQKHPRIIIINFTKASKGLTSQKAYPGHLVLSLPLDSHMSGAGIWLNCTSVFISVGVCLGNQPHFGLFLQACPAPPAQRALTQTETSTETAVGSYPFDTSEYG